MAYHAYHTIPAFKEPKTGNLETAFSPLPIMLSNLTTEISITVKPVLVTTCIKRPPALRDQCSDTTTLLKSITVKHVLVTTCIKRPPALRDQCSDTTLLKST